MGIGWNAKSSLCIPYCRRLEVKIGIKVRARGSECAICGGKVSDDPDLRGSRLAGGESRFVVSFHLSLAFWIVGRFGGTRSERTSKAARHAPRGKWTPRVIRCEHTPSNTSSSKRKVWVFRRFSIAHLGQCGKVYSSTGGARRFSNCTPMWTHGGA
jgi:hypothetical protein